MTVFEKITKSPETLGEVLKDLRVADAPWDTAFQRTYCQNCKLADCDAQGCPHQKQRSNPTWWLGLKAADVPAGDLSGVAYLMEVPEK